MFYTVDENLKHSKLSVNNRPSNLIRFNSSVNAIFFCFDKFSCAAFFKRVNYSYFLNMPCILVKRHAYVLNVLYIYFCTSPRTRSFSTAACVSLNCILIPFSKLSCVRQQWQAAIIPTVCFVSLLWLHKVIDFFQQCDNSSSFQLGILITISTSKELKWDCDKSVTCISVCLTSLTFLYIRENVYSLTYLKHYINLQADHYSPHNKVSYRWEPSLNSLLPLDKYLIFFLLVSSSSILSFR